MVKANKIEKVTFSLDGTQLLGVDTDGSWIKIEALPNDPQLLTDLTLHKVRNIVSYLRVDKVLGSRLMKEGVQC
jgi:hypothetical protein